MFKNKEQKKWFIVYSDLGYFKGLIKGGQLVWTQSKDEAKPLDHLNKFKMIKRLVPQNIEVIFEYIKK